MLIKALFKKVTRQKSQIKIEFIVDKSEPDFLFEDFEGFKGYLKFAGKPITREIEEAMDNRHLAPDINGKSKSQIIRGLCFELALLEGYDPELYYSSKMDEIIRHFRQKIKKNKQ